MRYRTHALILGFLVLYVVIAITRAPYGLWDAWANWNATARLLLYNDAAEVFRVSALSHKDYPPLLYLSVLWGYRLFGDTSLVPIVLHGAVYAGVLWFVRKLVWILIFVGIVTLPYAVSQYADLPLALAFLGTVIAYRHERPLWVGFALGCGLLIKNEGALIAVAFVAVWIVSARRIPWKAVIVIAPFAACLLVFRAVVNVPNDVTGSGGIIERLTDLSRYTTMLPLLVIGAVEFGGGALPVLGAALWLKRIRIVNSAPLIAAALVLAGYIGIYAITPHDLVWHITHSFDRLILHIFPVVVYEFTKPPN
jgi:hypothetical protein